MTISDWRTEKISATCLAEDCDWGAGKEVLLGAYESATEHAKESGHEVHVTLVSVRTVSHT